MAKQKLTPIAKRKKATRDKKAAMTADRRKKKAENQRKRRKAIKEGKNIKGKDYDHKDKKFKSIKKNRGNDGKGTKKENTLKKINFNKLKDKIQSSKFGQSKLGQGLTKVTGAIGSVQKKFVDTKKSLGLDTKHYDKTEKEGNISSEGILSEIKVPEVKKDDLLPETPTVYRRTTRRIYANRRKRK